MIEYCIFYTNLQYMSMKSSTDVTPYLQYYYITNNYIVVYPFNTFIVSFLKRFNICQIDTNISS